MTPHAEHTQSKPAAAGELMKWTNYVTGWQPRFFEIRDGTLLYYRSKVERSAGCRGSLLLKSARVEADEDGQLDFTVRISDETIWYLKAHTPTGRDRWIRKLTMDYDSDYSSSRTHSRTPSATSSILSQAVAENKTEQISSRIVELGGYRDLCEAQMAEIVEELEKVLSSSPSSSSIPSLTRQKLLTLKATHIAMLSNVDRILQLAADTAEHAPVHKVSKPPSIASNKFGPSDSNGLIEEKKTRSRHLDAAMDSPAKTPNGVTSDDEDMWHDANSERSSLRGDDEMNGGPATVEERTPRVSVCEDGGEGAGKEEVVASTTNEDRHLPFGSFDAVAFPHDHTLKTEVDHLTEEQLDYALTGASDPTMWNLFASDGEMRMYKREIELDGLPVDPLKALHAVKGVTALEYLHYFFDPKYKKDWDHTLEDVRVIETVSSDLVVLHQKHKTVWPAAPRESLFWSHLRRVDSWKSPEAHDCYIVCNKDVKRDDIPRGSSSAVRVGLTVSMICETHVDNPQGLPLSELPRTAFTCKIIYVSSVHPGGWVPTSALRHVYKREYPKFLRTFTTYVNGKVKHSKVAI